MTKSAKTPAITADLDKLTEIMKKLRSPEGCPWDREQTPESLTPFIIEEAYEVIGAIEDGNPEEIKEELGDLLFQVVFVSQLATEVGDFDIKDVIDSCVEKMIRRHPHVFGDKEASTSKEVLKHWAEIKRIEKATGSPGGEDAEEGGDGQAGESAVSGVPKAFPALLRAHKISGKAARAGFDWTHIDQVLDKVTEEVGEFKEAVLSGDGKATEDEMGDILFAMVNVSRFVEVNPEEALRKTIGRFIKRFHFIEKTVKDQGSNLSSTTLEEMERLWGEAKKLETQANSEA